MSNIPNYERIALAVLKHGKDLGIHGVYYLDGWYVRRSIHGLRIAGIGKGGVFRHVWPYESQFAQAVLVAFFGSPA